MSEIFETLEIKYCVGGCRQYDIVSNGQHYECSDCESDRRISEISDAISDSLAEVPNGSTIPKAGPGTNRSVTTGRRYKYVEGEWRVLRDARTQDPGPVKRVPPTLF